MDIWSWKSPGILLSPTWGNPDYTVPVQVYFKNCDQSLHISLNLKSISSSILAAFEQYVDPVVTLSIFKKNEFC